MAKPGNRSTIESGSDTSLQDDHVITLPAAIDAIPHGDVDHIVDHFQEGDLPLSLEVVDD